MAARMLGRLPRRHDKKPTVHLSDHLDATKVVVPVEVKAPQVNDWGMLLNDKLGCCTISAVGHLIDTWDALEESHRLRPTDDDVLDLYRLVTGGEDDGAMCLDVLDAWRLVGMAGDKVSAYVEVNPRNRTHVKLAISQFGGLYVGLAMPKTAMEQTEAHEPWDIQDDSLSDDDEPGSLGGHAVVIVGYDARGLTCVTWGQLQRMTWRWFGLCCDEAFAAWDAQDWLGDVPGLDREGLIGALTRLNDGR